MACRAVHFALNEKQYQSVSSCVTDQELVELIQDEIEEEWDEEWLRETDKAWDAIHRSLTDGKLEFNNGTSPLNLIILGGKQLHAGTDYVITLVQPEQVSEISNAISSIDQVALKKGYSKISQSDYDGDLSDADFSYTWSMFKELPSFYYKAAEEGRAVLFTVDQ